MKKVKKLLALMLAFVMVFSLAACGGSESAAEGDTASAGEAQYTVGICQLVQHEALDAASQGFMDAINKEMGEGTVEFVEQNAQGDSNTCSTIINDFVSSEVDLILANATAALQAAAAGTADIPILGTSITDYAVALEIDDFTGTVGGNISGTCDLAPLSEQANIIKELFPEAKCVGLLYCSAEANSQYQVDVITGELEALGYTCTPYAFSDSNDLATICEAASEASDVIYIPTDNTVAANTTIIENICLLKKVPVVSGNEGICMGCGVATLCIGYYELGYTTGQMAVKVLQGEDIATMPIAYAPNVTKKYVADRAAELGITIPEGYEEAVGE